MVSDAPLNCYVNYLIVIMWERASANFGVGTIFRTAGIILKRKLGRATQPYQMFSLEEGSAHKHLFVGTLPQAPNKGIWAELV